MAENWCYFLDYVFYTKSETSSRINHHRTVQESKILDQASDTCCKGGMMKKVLQFPLVRIIVAVLFVGFGFLVGQTALNLLRSAFSITNIELAILLAFILVTPITYFAYWAYVHYLEKRKLFELDPSNAFQEFGVGSLIGLVLFALGIGLLWLFGFYRFIGFDLVWISLISTLVGALVSAFVQELIFRGIIYRITEEWLGTCWAVAISTLMFGLIHLTSSGATIFSALALALQAGILLAAAYALTHRLWMVLGIHMAWDFANDGIFGVGVAGQTGQPIQGLLQARLSGPDLLTGGSFGVEASVITLVIVLIAGILLLWRSYQQGPFVTHASKSPIEIQAARSKSN
jgi:membrane protease YdiL (CAAX protease family)